jgi:hypothetical protein
MIGTFTIVTPTKVEGPAGLAADVKRNSGFRRSDD